MEPTIPLFWSTISMNWPITNGTDWIRLTSSCALRSSRFRFFCSSSQAAVATAYAVCTDPLPPYLFLPSRSSPAETSSPISPVQFRKTLHPIFPFLNPFSPSLCVTYGTFLCFSFLSSICSRNSVQTAKNSTQISQQNHTTLATTNKRASGLIIEQESELQWMILM